MGPVDGPVLGPFRNRTEALQAERGWLQGTAMSGANAMESGDYAEEAGNRILAAVDLEKEPLRNTGP